MAFITYRVSTTPTLATANVAKGLQLTNSEIDANFKALDDGKLEKNGSADLLTGVRLTAAAGVTGILPVANGGTGSSTASTGSGGVVLATSPTLVTPSLGVPSFIDLTNARNLPLDGTITVSGKLPIAFGGTNSTATPTAGTIPYGTGTAYAFTAAGTTGQVLTSAGAGTPTWATITTSAGGSNTQLQYNSSGSFAGSANMTFNGTTLALNSLSISTTLGVTGVSTLTGGAVIQGLTVGVGAGAVATNTAVGVSVLQANTTGSGNTAIGYQALYSNTGGIGNIASGRQALYSTTTGNNNTASGYQTLYSNLTGSNNIAIGASALYSNTAWNNIAIGTGAGTNLTTGANNVIIGSIAGTAGLVSTIIIGAGSTERLRVDSAGKMITLGQVQTPDVTSLLTTANTYPTTRPSLNLDFANSATLDPRITFTRGTNATYTGSDGLVKNTAGIHSPRFDWDPVTRECKGLLIEETRTNLLTYSNNLDNATWAKWGGATATLNTIVAPDGSTGAVTIIIPAGAGIFQSANTAASTTYTLSCWIRGDTTQTVSFVANTSLSEVSVITVTITTTWQRITLVKPTTTGTSITFQFYQSSTGAPFQVWGAQLELGAFATSYIPSSVTWTGRASTATYVGSNGLIQTAASGVARYQYNPTNLSVAPFLLLEPTATNLHFYSTVALTSAAAPNTLAASTEISALMVGSTITKSTRDTGTGDTNIGYFMANLSATTVYVGWMYVWIPASTILTSLNLTMDGAINPVANAADLTIRNQWQRIYVTATTVSTGVYAVVLRANGMVTGGYVYSTCYQIETGTYPTSYIPTVASQVTRIADTSTSAQTTRSADVATMTNSNFSSWYNFTEGTMIINVAVSYPAAYSGYTYMLGSFNDGIYHYRQSDSQSVVRIRVGSTDQFGALGWGATWATTAINKNALTYKLNDFNAANNGGAPGSSDTSGIVPTVNALTIGSNNGSSYINGTIAKLTYYPTRLSNSTLQALTT